MTQGGRPSAIELMLASTHFGGLVGWREGDERVFYLGVTFVCSLWNKNKEVDSEVSRMGLLGKWAAVSDWSHCTG